MSISARLPCGAALFVGLSLASLGAMAQEPAQSGPTWTDPPARNAAPATPAAKPPARVETQAETGNAKAPAAKTPSVETRAADTSAARKRPDAVSGARVRSAEGSHRRMARQVRRERIVASRARAVHPPAVATYRPTRERVTRFSYRAASPYREVVEEPLPVGRVEQPTAYGYGQRDERLDRIRAAQAAGYLVVHSRSVQFPDGRSLRTYQPYEGDED